MTDTILTIGGLAALLLAGILQIVRLSKKDPSFMFPDWVYALSLPVLNILLIPVGALLGLEGAVMPTDWMSWGRTALVVLLSSLVSLIGYAGGTVALGSYKASYARFVATRAKASKKNK